MAGRCRYGDLMLAGLLLASEEPQYFRCQWTATHLVMVGTDDDGFVVDIAAPVCPVHEAQVEHNAGYKRSIKLRSRPDAAATSPASES
jgi:hypothetical protein